MNARLYLLVIAIAFLSTGCAVGRTLTFSGNEVKNNFVSEKKLAVAAVEKRAEVLSGKKKPTYCGVLNSTVQIGYNVNTQSGLPLADEFAASLAGSLKSINPIVINTVYNQDASKLMNDFKASVAERLLLLTINKWEARAIPLFATIRYEVIYDLQLTLMDKNEVVLAEQKSQNIHAQTDSDLATSVKKLNAMASDVFTAELQKMLNAIAEKQPIALK